MGSFAKNTVICLAGPTSSGKSQLATELAHAFQGEIINADSMQIYQDLPILTAQPSPADRQQIPHHLYGVLPGSQACSVAQWLDMAHATIKDCHQRGVLPILVGGTGLYFKALCEGIAIIPDVSDHIRTKAEQKWQEIGAEAFYQEVQTFDTNVASQVKPSDRQRLIRAWSVYQTTGKALSFWQQQQPVAPYRDQIKPILLWPDRQDLYSRADRRFAQMVDQGALDEVKALYQKSYPAHCPVMKAVGVRELHAYSMGDIDLSAAISRAQLTTRHYIKRQYTWFRHQPPFAGLDRFWVINSVEEVGRLREKLWDYCKS